MKVAVVSNCQGEGVAKCIQAMNEALDVEFIFASRLWNGTADFLTIQRDCDLLLTQKILESHIAIEYAHKAHYFPSFTFTGFHPDMTYVRGTVHGGAVGTLGTVATPLSHYNSALALHGYLRGLTIDEIVASFNHDTFSRLGYLDAWALAKNAFLREADEIGLPLGPQFENWTAQGCFMHTFNHPTISVIADVAKALLKKIGIAIQNENPARYVIDDLRAMPIWPIYPEIAKELGLNGDYAFKRHEPYGSMGLRQFVEESVAAYEKFGRHTIRPLNCSFAEFDRVLGLASHGERADRSAGGNPYLSLPAFHFWKKSVAEPAMQEVDPVSPPRFTIDQSLKVATAGSCFAQHMARTLGTNGFNHLVTEPAPLGLDRQAARARNFGVFTARYGNIYTARQLTQLLKRVTGRFVPVELHWERSDGRLVDPFRPQIEPEGFADLTSLVRAREEHFAATRAMLEQMDVLVFTLGLTECWRSKKDGAVYPLAPGVAGGSPDPERYEFVNFTAGEVVADLQEAIDLLRLINPSAKIILTVSPVPLIATFEPRHVLASTTYSKAVLRVAAQEIREANNHVEYFPSYEIITGAHTKGSYFEDDLRSVNAAGVSHVMRLFMRHYAQLASTMSAEDTSAEAAISRHRHLAGIVCDEEAIANFAAP